MMLRSGLLLLFVLLAGCSPKPRPNLIMPSSGDEAFLDEVQQRTFNWFWETTNPQNGLVPDRWPTESFSSVAAVGFGLTAYPIGVERGWISRKQAIDRTLATLRFFWKAPQSPAGLKQTGYKGFYYHFLDMKTGERFRNVELSSIDTAWLMSGVLFAQSYFDQNNPQEIQIRAYADSLYRRVEWDWMHVRGGLMAMGWYPESGLHTHDYRGYDEAMMPYILGLGSPTFPFRDDAWDAYTSSYQWQSFYGQEHVNFSPLFGHQYTQMYLPLKGIQDAFMRAKGIDYFENSRRATLSQYAYAVANPNGWKDYSAEIWGLTACDGPLDIEREFNGKMRRFQTYTARGASAGYVLDDGTLSPTAVGGSLPFAPEITIPTLKAMTSRYGESLYSKYGFLDAFNPSFTFTDIKPQHGRVVPEKGWFDTDYLGIDQGPILVMIENYRTGLVWKTMQKNPYIRKGLERAGFRGGWLRNVPAVQSTPSQWTPERMPDVQTSPKFKRLVVMGSSTAEGVGPKVWENTWVNRLRSMVEPTGKIHVFNIARSAYTTFHLLPTGHPKVHNRPEPDVERNISKALSLNPDGIIINLPSNDTAAGYGLEAQMLNFEAILAHTKEKGIGVWITTTQPRNLTEEKRAELMQVRDQLKLRYGDGVIDFWHEVALEDGKISPRYDAGDQIHLNDAAHDLFFKRVEAALRRWLAQK
ncbi:MAG TPA: glucoamylase family protein [Rhodothermales bacterium]|nr:glucoamylase family protein [Rhodothermales bacterium]